MYIVLLFSNMMVVPYDISYAYEVCSTIIYTGYLVHNFSGNPCAQKINTVQTNQANIINIYTIFSRDLVFLSHKQNLSSTLFYRLSSLNFTSSQFSANSLLASTSASDSTRARCLHFRLLVRYNGCCVLVLSSICR